MTISLNPGFVAVKNRSMVIDTVCKRHAGMNVQAKLLPGISAAMTVTESSLSIVGRHHAVLVRRKPTTVTRFPHDPMKTALLTFACCERIGQKRRWVSHGFPRP